MNQTFLSIIVNALAVLDDLNLLSLEIEQTIEVCNFIVSLVILNILSTILLRVELLQIEAGIDKLMIEVPYNKYRSIVTKY